MADELLSEIRALKKAIADLIGTSDLPAHQQFSKEALDKVGKQFQKLSIERGDWVEDTNIDKYVKSASYRSGTFIIREFGFSNYFKRGHTLFFNKKALLELNKELKDRNINLKRYMEFVEDELKFKKYVAAAKGNTKGKKNKAFDIPRGLANITTSPIKPPEIALVKEDIQRLKEEFFRDNFADYIDIYRDSYAMMKFIYHFDKYLDPGIKKRCKKWCENFNYANHALEEITKKKEKFIPIKDDDMIQL